MNPSRDFFMKRVLELKKVGLKAQWKKIVPTCTNTVLAVAYRYLGTGNVFIQLYLKNIVRYLETVTERVEEMENISLDSPISKISDDLLEKALDPDSYSILNLLGRITRDIERVIDRVNELNLEKNAEVIHALEAVKKNIKQFMNTLVQSLSYFMSFRAFPVENAYYPNAVMGREVEFNHNFKGNVPIARRMNIPTNRNAPLGRHPNVLARRTVKRKPGQRSRVNTRTANQRTIRPVQGTRI